MDHKLERPQLVKSSLSVISDHKLGRLEFVTSFLSLSEIMGHKLRRLKFGQSQLLLNFSELKDHKLERLEFVQ